MENPIKMDDGWGYPTFRKPPYNNIRLHLEVESRAKSWVQFGWCLLSLVSRLGVGLGPGGGYRRRVPSGDHVFTCRNAALNGKII